MLVGVDTASTFCYLLSLEDHRDAETWGIRLLELADRGFAPRRPSPMVAMASAPVKSWPCPMFLAGVIIFHLVHDFEEVVGYLENRAYEAIATCEKRERARRHLRRRTPQSAAARLYHARAACGPAIALYDDVSLLLEWLRVDILSLAGPCYEERCLLYDFVVAELRARAVLCPHRLEPICRLLDNGKEKFLAFARHLDDDLKLFGAEFHCSADLLGRVLRMLCLSEHDPRRWTEETALRQQLRGRFWEVCEAVGKLRSGTVRASSLVENLNSRLRGYFFLRRHLGADYLSLLQFFLNHRRLMRSECPQRAGRSPAEILTGQPLPHWLNMLGYSRFQRT